ncbi:hypothetical protein HanRHA438_Chr13g0581461 [Helianthus annuus]|nr:hypothetical protein HanHA300_Chr13g0467431 [Helianthus annuus]KAJ0496389.1 hypothetical protein HanHA89_Chr13g0499161 [Helianthus annuus]KAJ0662448.1 hypothetical protein HanLR1_Chr13g0469591 [Helianthus annuus]KAJ0856707.1 hypothetical protein HanRHA438_Chr13g0581461 [Helianthus annuus]
MWWFTLIKYFLTTVLMKNSAAKLDHTRYHRTGSRPPVPEGSGVVTLDHYGPAIVRGEHGYVIVIR